LLAHISSPLPAPTRLPPRAACELELRGRTAQTAADTEPYLRKKEDGVDTGWPSAVVALGLLALIGGITIAAILSYDSSEALEFWSALSGLLGVITGAAATFFFTRSAVTAAQSAAQSAGQAAEAASEQAVATRSAVESMAAR
jgi:hypothetical protein